MTFPFSDICPTGTTFAREHLRPFECPLCKDPQNSVNPAQYLLIVQFQPAGTELLLIRFPTCLELVR